MAVRISLHRYKRFSSLRALSYLGGAKSQGTREPRNDISFGFALQDDFVTFNSVVQSRRRNGVGPHEEVASVVQSHPIGRTRSVSNELLLGRLHALLEIL